MRNFYKYIYTWDKIDIYTIVIHRIVDVKITTGKKKHN